MSRRLNRRISKLINHQDPQDRITIRTLQASNAETLVLWLVECVVDFGQGCEKSGNDTGLRRVMVRVVLNKGEFGGLPDFHGLACEYNTRGLGTLKEVYGVYREGEFSLPLCQFGPRPTINQTSMKLDDFSTVVVADMLQFLIDHTKIGQSTEGRYESLEGEDE